MAIMIWNKNSWASIVISSVGGNDYRIHFWFMSKNESMNSTKMGQDQYRALSENEINWKHRRQILTMSQKHRQNQREHKKTWLLNSTRITAATRTNNETNQNRKIQKLEC